MIGNASAPTESVLEDGTEEVRKTMLATLGEIGWRNAPRVTRRIRYAGDIQSLWYLRGDLMGVLAEMHGELAARRKIAAITQQFQGLLPDSMASRPRPLAG